MIGLELPRPRVAMLQKSYYLVLGVSHTESSSGIRRAFKELARRYHPDRAGPRCVSFYQEIVEAYHVLSDPERRRQYDRGLSDAENGPGTLITPVFANSAAEDETLVPEMPLPLRMEMNRTSFDAALAKISGWLRAGVPPMQKQCEGLDLQIILSPEQAAKGGIGFISVPSCSPCWQCGGSGRDGLFPCSFCEGEGLIEEKETVRVHIPPKAGDGMLIDLPLRGLGVHNFYLRLHIRVAF
jgi:molecular chaperone DnaJ